jgi:hypothetical protein
MGEGPIRRVSAIVLAIALLLALAPPVPFLKTLVVGEEGIFAYMAVDNGRPWQGGVFDVFFNGGRIGGQELISTSGAHPSPPYLFVRHGLRHATDVIIAVAHWDQFDNWSLTKKSAVARMPFYLLYSMSFLSLAIFGGYVLRRSVLASLPVFAVIVWLGSMPLQVGGAISPMYDGNVGVFLYAIAALCLFSASRTGRRQPQFAWMAAAGFAAALGKNEWGITFIAAIIGAIVLRWLWFRLSREAGPSLSESLGGPLALLAGLVVGTIANWATGREEFVAGFNLILQVADSTKNTSYAEVMQQRWRWIWPLFVLAPFAGILILVNARRLAGREFSLLVLGLWGLATVCAFMLSKWIGNGFPRYFCPGAFALGAFVVAMLRHPLPSIAKVVITAAALLLVGANLFHLREKYLAGVSVAEMPGLILSEREAFYRGAYAKFLATGEPQLGDVAMAYLFPDMDMTTGVGSLEWLRDALAKRRQQGW